MKVPTLKTLAKYGLSPEQFRELLEKYQGNCHLCRESLTGKMMFIDHEHVKGYSKFISERKRAYVRGILCYTCNRFKVCKNKLKDVTALVNYLSGDTMGTWVGCKSEDEQRINYRLSEGTYEVEIVLFANGSAELEYEGPAREPFCTSKAQG